MGNRLFYIPIRTESLLHCGTFLQQNGFSVTYSPSDQVTHLILPVPAFQENGKFTDGRSVHEILSCIPANVTVIGGNLDVPLLCGYPQFDLLKEEAYLFQNAAITAECALRIAAEGFPITFSEAPVLILGWGRIGKHLAKLLQGTGADISVAARKETDLEMISALGFRPVPYDALLAKPIHWRLVFNTVPAEVIPAKIVKKFPSNCKMIDLASSPGIGGNNTIWARGLPGKVAPESSGNLISKTILEYLSRKEDAL